MLPAVLENKLPTEIRIPVYLIQEAADFTSILESNGIEFSFQHNGETDEEGCKIMNLLPKGNWKYYHDVRTNEFVYSPLNWKQS